MATIIPFVRKSTKKDSDIVKIRYRVLDGRGVDAFFVSKMQINFSDWDAKRHCLKARIIILPADKSEIERSIIFHKQQLQIALSNLTQNGVKPTSKALSEEMYHLLNPSAKNARNAMNFFDYFDSFCEAKQVSISRSNAYKMVCSIFKRFENYKMIFDKKFSLDIKNFSSVTAEEFLKFIQNEHIIVEKHNEIYTNKKISKPRSTNSVVSILKTVKAFFNYLKNKKRVLQHSPFSDLDCPAEAYGTPFYLTITERNQLYNYDLSEQPDFEKQRDIFVFHCVIGCRAGDLFRLTKSNIVNGGVEYIAGKTRDGNPKTIRVPLNKVGLEILEKYKYFDGDKLFPFARTKHLYNEAIREVLKRAGVNRIVTIMDSQTRLDIQKPIYEVASSHLARRTLYANVYKKFKDPALAGSLTGHSPNSKAALRYRDIDEDIKLELVRSLE
jgi:integrase